MNKIRVFISCAAAVISIALPASGQQFQTGVIGVSLDNDGRLKFYAPNLSTEQINRTSILVGRDIFSVFDYGKDAASWTPAYNIPLPTLSDYEVFGAINNGLSNLPPEVHVRTHIYGWEGEAYCLVKYDIISQEDSAFNAIVGLEILPRIEGEYGSETVQFIPGAEVVSIHKSNDYVGYKFLTTDITSFRVIDWYEGYNDLDFDLWEYLTFGGINYFYIGGSDGTVCFPAQPGVELGYIDTTTVWLALAYGTAQYLMMDNIEAAELAFNGLNADDFTTGYNPPDFILEQNYPNPFNPATEISFRLEEAETVELAVFNSLGMNVAILLKGKLAPGYHSVVFEGEDLPTGCYFFRLTTETNAATRKMLLVK